MVLTASEMPTFVLVRMLESAAAVPVVAISAPAAPSSAVVPTGLIEIELGDGRRVRVGSGVTLPALRGVLAALGR